jgi:hypothetical protein
MLGWGSVGCGIGGFAGNVTLFCGTGIGGTVTDSPRGIRTASKRGKSGDHGLVGLVTVFKHDAPVRVRSDQTSLPSWQVLVLVKFWMPA